MEVLRPVEAGGNTKTRNNIAVICLRSVFTSLLIPKIFYKNFTSPFSKTT